MSVFTIYRGRPLLACTIALVLGAVSNAGDGLAPGSASDVDKPNPHVGFDQKLGDKVPLDLPFTDEDGNDTTLAKCVAGKPTILILAYYRCPMLCGEVFGGVLDAIRHFPATMTCGKEFNIVCVSFDPKEHHDLAHAKKMHFVTEYGRKEADWGWHWLTGHKDSIDKLTTACGFRYEFDPMLKEYNHPSGIMIISPEGIISRYFPGIEYLDRGFNGQLLQDPAKTLRLSLVEASDGEVGTPSDKVFLSCYQYNPHTGKYSANVMLIMRTGGLLTLLLIVGVYAWTSWKTRWVKLLVLGIPAYIAVLVFFISPPVRVPLGLAAAIWVVVFGTVLLVRRMRAKRVTEASPPLAGAGVE